MSVKISDLPEAVHSAELEVCGVKLRVHVLDDGRRIIEARDVAALFEAWELGVGMTPEETWRLAQALRGKKP